MEGLLSFDFGFLGGGGVLVDSDLVDLSFDDNCCCAFFDSASLADCCCGFFTDSSDLLSFGFLCLVRFLGCLLLVDSPDFSTDSFFDLFSLGLLSFDFGFDFSLSLFPLFNESFFFDFHSYLFLLTSF